MKEAEKKRETVEQSVAIRPMSRLLRPLAPSERRKMMFGGFLAAAAARSASEARKTSERRIAAR